MQCKILKIDKMKQIVYGVVLKPTTPKEPDLQGDVYNADVIEDAMHNFMMSERICGFRHKEKLDAVIVDCTIIRQSEYYENVTVPAGSWFVGMKIFDKEVWQGVLDGTYNSFSVGGEADYEFIDNIFEEGDNNE